MVIFEELNKNSVRIYKKISPTPTKIASKITVEIDFKEFIFI
jgi:hypothetical protein